MNSKQRAQAAFNGKTPDRPPLGFFAIDSDTASRVMGRETFWRAKAKCRIALWEGRRDEVAESWIRDGIELYRKLDIVDIVPICCEAACLVPPEGYEPDPPKKIDDTTWEDRTGRIFKFSPVTNDITVVHDPRQHLREIKAEDAMWNRATHVPDESRFVVVEAFLEAFQKDRFVLGPCGPVAAWTLLGGMERGFTEIALRPDEIKRIYESQCERAKAADKYYCRRGHDGVLLGTDLANSNGPFINPKVYRKVFFDAYKSRIGHLKDQGLTVVQHACGNNALLLDMFADLGIDCYQSIQASAGMDLAEVQRDYGEKFAVWGGVNVETLMHGTQQDVRNEVDHIMEKAAPHGGFILGTSHSVAVGSNYDNFMALLDQYSKWT